MTSGPARGQSPGAVHVARTAWRRLLLRARVRQGASRVRVALWPILQASAAAGLAFGIARYGLGHTAPFFAPVSAWICLGFSQDRQLRRVLELAVGVAIGVGLGDLVVHAIGSGWWQVAVVLAVSALAARFIDRGAMLTTQAGVQAIVIVGLPAAQAGGPLGRWTDALVGGAVALAVAALTPAGAAGREWDVVVVAGVQDGVWPDLRLRDSLLGSQALVELLAGRAQDAHGVGSQARAQVLADELRAFVVATSRATRRLVVTAVQDAEEAPSVFCDLVVPPSAPEGPDGTDGPDGRGPQDGPGAPAAGAGPVPAGPAASSGPAPVEREAVG
ncbi:FUSC family protein, partial [Cellulosimicrobium funkei]|uniref:FUSC family protein n=1 Tax=Cellulosimicrobium funkei TaxID=264251 RepID=UPI003756C45D